MEKKKFLKHYFYIPLMNTGYGDPSVSTPLSTRQTSAWFEMEKSCKGFKGKHYEIVSQIMESFPMEDFRKKKKKF